MFSPETLTLSDPPLRWIPEAPSIGRLTLGTGHRSSDYTVVEFRADGGRGFHLLKAGADEPYAVFLYAVFLSANAAAEPHRCDCRGFERYGACKHLEAIEAIIAAGRLWSVEEAAEVWKFLGL